MSVFPAPAPQKPRRSGKAAVWWWVIIAVAAVLLIVFVPALAVILGLVGLIVGIIQLVVRSRRARKSAEHKPVGSAVAMAAIGALSFAVGTGVLGASVPTEAQTVETVASESATVTPPASQEALEDRVGQSCDNDRLAVTLEGASVYCDEDASGALVWVTEEDHTKAQAAAAQKAADEAAAQKKAADEAAAKKKAAEKKAADEAAAKKKAAEKKAAEEAAAKKKAAQERAAAEAAAKKKAQQKAAAAKKKTAEQAEAQRRNAVSTPAYYANCSAVRAAGAAPLYSGQPGYSFKLDRDKDGVACE